VVKKKKKKKKKTRRVGAKTILKAQSFEIRNPDTPQEYEVLGVISELVGPTHGRFIFYASNLCQFCCKMRRRCILNSIYNECLVTIDICTPFCHSTPRLPRHLNPTNFNYTSIVPRPLNKSSQQHNRSKHTCPGSR